MSKARKADLGKLKPEKKALYLNEIEDKLLKREADKKINLHRPSFAAYTIANGLCGVKPSPRVTSLFIEPLDDEIEDMFKKVQDEVTEMFGEDI